MEPVIRVRTGDGRVLSVIKNAEGYFAYLDTGPAHRIRYFRRDGRLADFLADNTIDNLYFRTVEELGDAAAKYREPEPEDW